MLPVGQKAIAARRATKCSIRPALLTGEERAFLRERAGYEGVSYHKRSPGDFGLTPRPRGPLGGGFRNAVAGGRTRIVVTSSHPTSQRFYLARMIGAALVLAPDQHLVPVTTSYSALQKLERSFAQEHADRLRDRWRPARRDVGGGWIRRARDSRQAVGERDACGDLGTPAAILERLR